MVLKIEVDLFSKPTLDIESELYVRTKKELRFQALFSHVISTFFQPHGNPLETGHSLSSGDVFNLTVLYRRDIFTLEVSLNGKMISEYLIPTDTQDISFRRISLDGPMIVFYAGFEPNGREK